MKQLTIVYHYFAHYREPVLRQLCESLSSTYEIELMSDSDSNLPSLKTIPMEEFAQGLCSWKRLKNKWLGAWYWQTGLVSNVMKSESDAFIFLGEAQALSTWVAVLIARFRGKKTYYWSHGVYGNEKLLKRLYRVSFCKLAHGMFLYGNHAKQLLIQYGMPERNLHLIYNSLDYQLQKKLRDQKQVSIIKAMRCKCFGDESASTPMVVFIGRLTTVKRLDLLLEAIRELNDEKHVPVNCLIIGDGPEHSSLVDLAQALGLWGRVHFFGPSHDEEVLSDLLYASDVCVAPGNVGLTAMHALVYGTPVITHDDPTQQMPEFEAIEEGVSGGFFQKNNSSDLTQTIMHWLSRSEDERDAVRTACYKVIDDNYNPANQARIFSEVIGAAL